MHLRFLTPELTNLDALKCEAILAPFFSDERPLQGALGLIDWRLCGFVSRMLMNGAITGGQDETVLVPLRPRFTVDKLFLFGLGRESEFDAGALDAVITRMLGVVTRAKVRTTAVVLPGRSTYRIEPSQAMESFVLAQRVHADQDEVILIEPVEGQRVMEPIFQRERRRVRASGGP